MFFLGLICGIVFTAIIGLLLVGYQFSTMFRR